jgi:hypothetical protein
MENTVRWISPENELNVIHVGRSTDVGLTQGDRYAVAIVDNLRIIFPHLSPASGGSVETSIEVSKLIPRIRAHEQASLTFTSTMLSLRNLMSQLSLSFLPVNWAVRS